MNFNITAGTIARTAVLLLALINQMLSAMGKSPLPIESTTVEQLVTAGITTIAALVAWWKNNSFTKEAIAADKEYDRLKALADEQIAAINEKVAAARKRMENGTSYLTSCLADFFATVPHKETKTTEKYRLLSGTLTFKKGTTKTKLDETKLVPWLKANGYGELVKVEESTRWADLKKLLSYTGDIATLTETGEIVEGVTVYETPGIFTVDV